MACSLCSRPVAGGHTVLLLIASTLILTGLARALRNGFRFNDTYAVGPIGFLAMVSESLTKIVSFAH